MNKHCCGSCGYDWQRDGDNIGCGAPFDDAEIRKLDGGNNPIWAVRKYGPLTILGMLAGTILDFPDGSDADNLNPEDGKLCATFVEKLK